MDFGVMFPFFLSLSLLSLLWVCVATYSTIYSYENPWILLRRVRFCNNQAFDSTMALVDNPKQSTSQAGGVAPVLIPLHNDCASSDGGLLEEWAMIELNGELIAPATPSDKENPTPTAEFSCIGQDQVELGSVRFVDNVSPAVSIPWS